MEKELEDYFYYKYIEAEGDQDKFFDSIREIKDEDVPSDKDITSLEAKRFGLVQGSFSGAIHYNSMRNIKEDHEEFYDLFRRFMGEGDRTLFMEWIGDIDSLDCKKAIFIEDFAGNDWIVELAKKHSYRVSFVTSLVGAFDEDFVGPKYAFYTIYPTGEKCILLGTQEDCYKWASRFSCIALITRQNPSRMFTEYVKIKNYDKENCLAVPGDTGCYANELIRKGWTLVDRATHVEEAIENFDLAVDRMAHGIKLEEVKED